MSPERAATAGSAPSSQTTCSARPGSGGGPAPSQSRVRPHASERRSSSAARDVIGRADGEQDVAGPGEEPEGAGEVHRLDVYRRERPFAHDDRVDELDGHVAGVRRPLRGDAPHRGPGGEPAGEGKRAAARSSAGPSHLRLGIAPLRSASAPIMHPPRVLSNPAGPPGGDGNLAEGKAAVVRRDEPVGEHLEAAAPSSARARPTRRTFWKTPPLSATRSRPFAGAQPLGGLADEAGDGEMEAGGDGAGGTAPAEVGDDRPQHRGRVDLVAGRGEAVGAGAPR